MNLVEATIIITLAGLFAVILYAAAFIKVRSVKVEDKAEKE